MPINATVTLDSGSFLPMKKDGPCEIGYFACEDSVSDIRIFIDGEEPADIPHPFKLCYGAAKPEIEIRHTDKNGKPKTDGINPAESFHSHLLHFKQLYGENQEVDRSKYDCILQFNSGHLRASMIKRRSFKEHKKQSNGSFAYDETVESTSFGPIAHNMVVSFTLQDGDVLELVRDGSAFWTSEGRRITERLEIEIVADNSTAIKFYKDALKDDTKTSYLLPNQGDPPPSCPFPPCPTRGTN